MASTDRARLRQRVMVSAMLMIATPLSHGFDLVGKVQTVQYEEFGNLYECEYSKSGELRAAKATYDFGVATWKFFEQDGVLYKSFASKSTDGKALEPPFTVEVSSIYSDSCPTLGHRTDLARTVRTVEDVRQERGRDSAEDVWTNEGDHIVLRSGGGRGILVFDRETGLVIRHEMRDMPVLNFNLETKTIMPRTTSDEHYAYRYEWDAGKIIRVTETRKINREWYVTSDRNFDNDGRLTYSWAPNLTTENIVAGRGRGYVYRYTLDDSGLISIKERLRPVSSWDDLVVIERREYQRDAIGNVIEEKVSSKPQDNPEADWEIARVSYEIKYH